jgi:hypothetical protein
MKVLIIGSAPDSSRAQHWKMDLFDLVVVINNAWRIKKKWDELIFPHDFSTENTPTVLLKHQKIITEEHFVPAQNLFGGFVYAGATMAFTAGYWALANHKPSKICFLGCNMHYSQDEPTHFYGWGKPDPLRNDISLTSLKACSYRMLILAKNNGCEIVSLSHGESNLHVPQISPDDLTRYQSSFLVSETKVEEALKREKQLNYYVEDGRYWEKEHSFCRSELVKLDQIWTESLSFETPKQSKLMAERRSDESFYK